MLFVFVLSAILSCYDGRFPSKKCIPIRPPSHKYHIPDAATFPPQRKKRFLVSALQSLWDGFLKPNVRKRNSDISRQNFRYNEKSFLIYQKNISGISDFSFRYTAIFIAYVCKNGREPCAARFLPVCQSFQSSNLSYQLRFSTTLATATSRAAMAAGHHCFSTR